jgi:hypothetical protein
MDGDDSKRRSHDRSPFQNSGIQQSQTREGVMAKIIEFYVPSSFRKKASKWIPAEECGKVIPFGVPQKKSA